MISIIRGKLRLRTITFGQQGPSPMTLASLDLENGDCFTTFGDFVERAKLTQDGTELRVTVETVRPASSTFALLEAADALGLDNPDGSGACESERQVDQLSVLLDPAKWPWGAVKNAEPLRLAECVKALEHVCTAMAAEHGALRDGVADGLDGRLLRAWKAWGRSLSELAMALACMVMGCGMALSDAALVDMLERLVEASSAEIDREADTKKPRELDDEGSDDFRIDPVRYNGGDRRTTGIPIRARLGDSAGTYDIADLDGSSLLAWLRSGGGESRLAENVVGVLLGHGHLHAPAPDARSHHR